MLLGLTVLPFTVHELAGRLQYGSTGVRDGRLVEGHSASCRSL